ncbi:DUF1298 domain-containing protein [Streptomyces ipomoeae]|uniref:DUF1298 domain-containing protein n=2 Tax=Streptomyces ipomoeae TaxID=103232 RepID=A0AAE9AWI8_9ACTN|nr:DUF1298 domain-containing protein [Streptomyces ipomoeae]
MINPNEWFKFTHPRARGATNRNTPAQDHAHHLRQTMTDPANPANLSSPNLIDKTFLSFNGQDQPVITFALDYHGPCPPLEPLRDRVAKRASLLPGLRPMDSQTGKNVFRLDGIDIDEETNRLLGTPFSFAGTVPLWDVWLLSETRDTNHFRVLFRAHHGFLDGVGATHLLSALLPDAPGEGSRLYAPGKASARGRARVLRDLVASLAGRGDRPPPRPAKPSAPARRHAFQDVPLTVVRALADSYGVSVNDVNMAALCLALGNGDGLLGDASVGVAMSTRTPAERHSIGNRLGMFRLTVPSRVTSLKEAVHHVHRHTQKLRDTAHRDALRKTMDMKIHPKIGVPAFRSMLKPKNTPLVVSSVTVPLSPPHHLFGAELRSAAMMLNVFDGFPAYVSFTRTNNRIRCAAISDDRRAPILALPGSWASALHA